MFSPPSLSESIRVSNNKLKYNNLTGDHRRGKDWLAVDERLKEMGHADERRQRQKQQWQEQDQQRAAAPVAGGRFFRGLGGRGGGPSVGGTSGVGSTPKTGFKSLDALAKAGGTLNMAPNSGLGGGGGGTTKGYGHRSPEQRDAERAPPAQMDEGGLSPNYGRLFDRRKRPVDAGV